jgi:large subunit ribosomal protein L10
VCGPLFSCLDQPGINRPFILAVTTLEERRNTLLAITKKRKQEMVDQYVELLERTNGFVIIEYKGMSVNNIDLLRAKIREAEGQYLVAKNTLFTRALQQLDWPVPDNLLKGPTAVAFGLSNFPAVAKAVLEFTSEGDRGEKVWITGGVMTGEILNVNKVEAISKLPSLDEMRSQLAGLIVAPATGLVTVLNAANSQLVNVLQAYLDDKGQGDEAA